jgi:hypothetical protein
VATKYPYHIIEIEGLSPITQIVSRYIYTLYLQLQVKPSNSSIGVILVELRISSVQGVFRAHLRKSWSVLSARRPAANQSQVSL